MNREIKFRAWANYSGVMFHPDTDDGWEIKNGRLVELPNTTLMQFTGLHDRNGDKIYENDWIKFNAGHIEEKVLVEIPHIYQLDYEHAIDSNCEVAGNKFED